MDLRQALVTAVYARLTEDPTLQGICGGTVRMINGMPQPNTAFPYLTHRFVLETGACWAFAEGTWYLDLWDHASSTDRLLEMRQAVITLMDQLLLEPPGGEAVVVRIGLVRDEDGPTDAPDVYRLMTQWGLHLDRQVEVEAILGR